MKRHVNYLGLGVDVHSMQTPDEKTPDPVVSPLFVGAIHDELRRYDGMRVGETRPCPNCSSTDLRKNGYQREPKTFARLVTESGFEDVGVQVQQYECKACGRSFQGDLTEDFYDRCDYAKPIVDACLFHAADTAYNHCERLLNRLYGLQVDRDTIRRYDQRFGDRADLAGVQVGGSVLSVDLLAFLFGETDGPHFVITEHTALW